MSDEKPKGMKFTVRDGSAVVKTKVNPETGEGGRDAKDAKGGSRRKD